jgi:hypothetical protein
MGRGQFGVWVAAVLSLGGAFSLPARSEDERVVLPVVFHVARDERDAPVAGARFLAVELASANDVFAPLAVQFELKKTLSLPPGHASVVTREDRDAMLTYVRPGAIHCMVVGRLLDVDTPGRVRRGVHWYAEEQQRPHMLILSTGSEPRVLAHELGHYLGLPEHRQVAGNIMSYLWGEGIPRFDADQALRVKRTLARFKRNREL